MPSQNLLRTSIAILGSVSSHAYMSSNSAGNGAVVRLGPLAVAENKKHVLASSATTVALQRLAPILPGHSIVLPRREGAGKLAELSERELEDLFECVTECQQLLEDGRLEPQPSGFNLSIKDGLETGQVVPRVHVHVVPRFKGDLKSNDLVYSLLERWTPDPSVIPAPRPLPLEVSSNHICNSTALKK